MKRVGRDAVLDEASVRNADQRATEWRRPTTRQARTASNPVTSVVVHPDVWAAAKAAMRPGQRLVIINEDCVRVVNQ